MIERVPHLTRAEFAARFLRRGPPVVITGELSACAGATRWTFDELRARWGERRVPAWVTPGGDWTYACDRETVPFSTLIDAALTSKPGADRLSGPQLSLRDIPWAADGVGVPRFIPDERVVTSNLWLQAAGDKTHLHCDGKPGLLGLLHGEKEIALFSPDQWRSLYPSIEPGGDNWSRVDFWHPDESMFPLFADAQPIRVTLHAGEMLFVPVTWWHCVRTVVPSIALNWWWSEPDAEIADVYRHLWGFAAKIAAAEKPGRG